MRLWSIHPRYLDTKGLLAVWREGLLALNVLQGNTKGYKNHSQLIRFKSSTDPVLYVKTFLYHVWQEANNRKYNFDISKIEGYNPNIKKLNVNNGQVNFERSHLLKKLKERDINKFKQFENEKFECHPLFNVINGNVESWEKT